MGHVIFSQYFGLGQQNLCPRKGVGYEFLDHHFSKCSGPSPLYLLTGPLENIKYNRPSSGRGLETRLFQRFFFPEIQPYNFTTIFQDLESV